MINAGAFIGDCGVFFGEVLIGKKTYFECSMKYDGSLFHEMKQGCFNITTFLMKDIDVVAENEKEFALEMSRIVDIEYIKPKVNTTKYRQKIQIAKCLSSKTSISSQLYRKYLCTKKVLSSRNSIYTSMRRNIPAARAMLKTAIST